MMKKNLYHIEMEHDFMIEHLKRKGYYRYHIHDHMEMKLILSPNVIFQVGDTTYNLEPNSLLLINSMDLHRLFVRDEGEFECYTLYFRPSYISDFISAENELLECFYFRPFDNPHVITLKEKQSASLQKLLNRLLTLDSIADEKFFKRELCTKFNLGELLLEVNAYYRLAHGITNEDISAKYGLIYEIIHYIHCNLASDLSLDHLSSRFFISKFYLCNLFKNVTGTSPTQYIIDCRISKAKELLVKGYSVDDVCGQVGYGNLSNFSKSFKQHEGISPKQYAKKRLKKTD